MKTCFKYIILTLLPAALMSSCKESFLDIKPEDRITEDNFWKSEQDTHLALYGIYNTLKERHVYGYGGGIDACSPNAYQWAYWEGMEMQVGDGTIQPGDGGIVSERWRDCYKGINRANYFLANVDKVEMDEKEKETMKGEAYFLRGVFYALLADSYGGVPLITTPISVDTSRLLKRASEADTWKQVHADYAEAIKRLPEEAELMGRATLGAAYGMDMRAYLYEGNWDKVIEYADKITALNRYGLFHSYQGLFQLANEDNEEVIFDVQFMDGPFQQGSVFDRYWQPQNLKYGIDGSNSVAPIQNLVDAYETLDGAPVDPDHPYDNRDPRLDFTILRPGALFQGQKYPEEIKNHTGQKVGFAIRKYTIETQQVKAEQSPLNFIVLRYADVLLSKAEALIEKGGSGVPQAIDFINQIRNGRDDVKLKPLSAGLSAAAAREALRHERRIEFAMEGLYWSDVRRWGIGTKVYPIQVRGGNGELIETKFANGYNPEKNDHLPIPDDEISQNPNLEQNPGY
ncbi:RagB/SusD family nutrient uptake outer membrane protein [Compostibacter hankyongensis]|uniref:RagB/SusD family nutrient uptake outer membrane protein n=1 Tax=Compostibacter hankyongensis TaxID=1007089 RepID=A0ABP8FY90_9BACT